MPGIHIIQNTPGPTTTERILELIQSREQGITIKEISLTLNRSVSMVQRCLKLLMASGQIYSKLDKNGMHRVYYPVKDMQADTH